MTKWVCFITWARYQKNPVLSWDKENWILHYLDLRPTPITLVSHHIGVKKKKQICTRIFTYSCNLYRIFWIKIIINWPIIQSRLLGHLGIIYLRTPLSAFENHSFKRSHVLTSLEKRFIPRLILPNLWNKYYVNKGLHSQNLETLLHLVYMTSTQKKSTRLKVELDSVLRDWPT